MENHLAPEQLPVGFLPLTVTNLTMTPTAIPLGPSLQGTSQFLIVFPPGIEPRGILYSRSMGGRENLSDNLLSQQDMAEGLSYEPIVYTHNQPPTLAHQYDMIFPGDTISNPVFDNLFSAAPEPSSNYPEVLNHPIAECFLDENRNSTEPEWSSLFMGQRDAGTHFDGQNTQPTLNAAAAASQQAEGIFWMSPNIPHDFVPAPSFPEDGIRFEEPAMFAASSLADSQRTHLCSYGSSIATPSRRT
ncbi:hypothetical protein BDZ91DRAFT_712529 [Kalaharituber pfeilii]|nr:hypothetical protein BDZ91DRAFT_712529 [Kalaharituber pfeilii]